MSDEQHPANLITFPSLPFTAPPPRTRRRARADEEPVVVEAESRTGPSLSASQFYGAGAGRTLRSGSSTAAREERHQSREQQLQQSDSARSTAREERHRSREEQLQQPGPSRSSKLKAEIGKPVVRAKVNMTNSFLVLSLFRLLQLWANCSVS